MKKLFKNPYVISTIVTIGILAIIIYNKSNKPYKLYAKPSDPSTVCFKDENGVENCIKISFPENRRWIDGSVGNLTYKAYSNGGKYKGTMTVVLYDKDENHLDMLVTKKP